MIILRGHLQINPFSSISTRKHSLSPQQQQQQQQQLSFHVHLISPIDNYSFCMVTFINIHCPLQRITLLRVQSMYFINPMNLSPSFQSCILLYHGLLTAYILCLACHNQFISSHMDGGFFMLSLSLLIQSFHLILAYLSFFICTLLSFHQLYYLHLFFILFIVLLFLFSCTFPPHCLLFFFPFYFFFL